MYRNYFVRFCTRNTYPVNTIANMKHAVVNLNNLCEFRGMLRTLKKTRAQTGGQAVKPKLN